MLPPLECLVNHRKCCSSVKHLTSAEQSDRIRRLAAPPTAGGPLLREGAVMHGKRDLLYLGIIIGLALLLGLGVLINSPR